MIFYFVESHQSEKPRVRMTLCQSKVEAQDCAKRLPGETVLHEVEASDLHSAACKLVAQHRVLETDIGFLRPGVRKAVPASKL